MTLTNLFQIDGKSLYAPDCDIEPSYSDLDPIILSNEFAMLVTVSALCSRSRRS